MKLPRASGILLHPTSLPGRHGIGDLGQEAHAFVDFLADTGQTWWQMLPVGPTGYGNSPYQSPSTFAGNPLLISPEGLAERGWLTARELEEAPAPSESTARDAVDFDAAAELKMNFLRRAFARFQARSRDADEAAEFETFREANRDWLEDYVFFQALRDAHDFRPWFEWESDLAARTPGACARWRAKVAEGARFHEFVQFAFGLQWAALREKCQSRHVRLIGDVPIFVAHDSVDVWAHPDLYYLDERGMPIVMAGVPPDYFSETGQLWGNPLYRWEAHASDGFAWWLRRVRGALERVDLIRIDHFRGFAAYWEVPAGSETAATGRWMPAPGHELFRTIRRELGDVPLIAEDLGVITPDVEELRDDFNLPGMRVIQFGFDADPASEKHLPHRYVPHCLAYTGTHDNDTAVGWFEWAPGATTQAPAEAAAARAFAARYTHSAPVDVPWALARAVFASVADTAIVPLQDVLGLDGRARMNFPGKAVGNWHWRLHADQLDEAARDRLAELTAVYNRWNGTVPPRWEPRYRPPDADTVAPLEP